MILILIAVGIWVSGSAEEILGKKDAPAIVIDEIAGTLLTYFTLPAAMLPMLTGFFFFRAFDIFKPLPQLERIHGGLGVMLDDLFAGVIAHFCVRLVLFLF